MSVAFLSLHPWTLTGRRLLCCRSLPIVIGKTASRHWLIKHQTKNSVATIYRSFGVVARAKGTDTSTSRRPSKKSDKETSAPKEIVDQRAKPKQRSLATTPRISDSQSNSQRISKPVNQKSIPFTSLDELDVWLPQQLSTIQNQMQKAIDSQNRKLLSQLAWQHTNTLLQIFSVGKGSRTLPYMTLSRHLTTKHKSLLAQWFSDNASYVPYFEKDVCIKALNAVAYLQLQPKRDDPSNKWLPTLLTAYSQLLSTRKFTLPELAHGLNCIAIITNHVDPGFIQLWCSTCVKVGLSDPKVTTSALVMKMFQSLRNLKQAPTSTWLTAVMKVSKTHLQNREYTEKEMVVLINGLLLPSPEDRHEEDDGDGDDDENDNDDNDIEMNWSSAVNSWITSYLTTIQAMNAKQPFSAKSWSIMMQQLSFLNVKPQKFVPKWHTTALTTIRRQLFQVDRSHPLAIDQRNEAMITLANVIWELGKCKIDPDRFAESWLKEFLEVTYEHYQHGCYGGDTKYISMMLIGLGVLKINPDLFHPNWVEMYLNVVLTSLKSKHHWTNASLAALVHGIGQSRITPLSIHPESWTLVLQSLTEALRLHTFNKQDLCRLCSGLLRASHAEALVHMKNQNNDSIKSLQEAFLSCSQYLLDAHLRNPHDDHLKWFVIHLTNLVQGVESLKIYPALHHLEWTESLHAVISARISTGAHIIGPFLHWLVMSVSIDFRVPSHVELWKQLLRVAEYKLATRMMRPHHAHHYLSAVALVGDLDNILADSQEIRELTDRVIKGVLRRCGQDNLWRVFLRTPHEIATLAFHIANNDVPVTEYPMLFAHLKRFFAEMSRAESGEGEGVGLRGMMNSQSLHRLLTYHQYILATTGERLLEETVWDTYANSFEKHMPLNNLTTRVERQLHSQLRKLDTKFISGYFVKEILSVVDFYHPFQNTVIQIDGHSHLRPTGQVDGTTRLQTKMLKMFGYQVIRILNTELHKLNSLYVMDTVHSPKTI